ncbi:DUF4349 domain-containing protein [Nocardioides KLBMP 9356]|uniref:DUF4349 domain-containing protein n=1 Tax=Nocardioides potassii TaxID=2911371 RepID=A0ABS9H8S3_9ACTN|nr:DUF4349 domain-containing protein [Nocardioides potassii]MCF6376506.1 DUF4349 domain-containing protein [Nocardioides potassii]
MSTRTRASGLLLAIIMTAPLAACSSSSDSGASDGGGSASSADMDAGNGVGAEAPGGASRDFSDSGATTSSPKSASAPGTPQMERAVVSSGTVSMSSKDVAKTRQDVQRIVDAQGGDITEETSESDDAGRTSYARFVVRVPSGRFGDAMTALEEVDGVVASSRGSEDVTTQVIDTDVRVRAQEASLKRVELLLAEATSLKNLIWIESQLTTRQAELDSLKSQQSWLTDQTSLSTITVDISRKHDDKASVVEDDDAPAGFLDGLRGGTKALGGTFALIALVAGALLPFAVVALVIGVPAWLVVRRRRTSAPASAETPAG